MSSWSAPTRSRPEPKRRKPTYKSLGVSVEMTRATPPPAKRPRRQSRNTGPPANPFSVSAGRHLPLAALKALSEQYCRLARIGWPCHNDHIDLDPKFTEPCPEGAR